MPVRSCLPDDIDLDDIESCKISGMSESAGLKTPPKTQLELDIEEVMQEREDKQHKGPGNSVKLPKITDKREVLRNSQPATPRVSSEEFWGKISYLSDEKTELQKIIKDHGVNYKISLGSVKPGDSTQLVLSVRSQQVKLNKEGTELYDELNMFIQQSQNSSDYLIVNAKNEIVDVLTQEKMRRLWPDSAFLRKVKKKERSSKEATELNVKNLEQLNDVISSTSDVQKIVCFSDNGFSGINGSQ